MQISLILCSLILALPSAPTKLPRVFLLNPTVLDHERELARSTAAPDEFLKAAHAEADRAMTAEPFSVMHKDVLPPSGDKHDYMSLAPYFWPNPETPTHLPYVRRDGERNPEIKGIPDHDEMGKMASSARALALAYYLSGDEAYASRAALLLRTWFLDSSTKMNPNLEYAQGIRGLSSGRGIGIIDSHGLTEVVDGVGLLKGSKNWTTVDDEGMRRWFTSFLNWLRSSKNGKDESNAKNNHGSFYDVQVVDYALFLGQRELAQEVAQNAARNRIAVQIEADGRQPLELARTKSFGYSCFNLRALTELATLGEHLGVDLSHFETRDGRSIRRALDYLLPYAEGQKSWPYKEISGVEPEELAGALFEASLAYQEPRYEAAARKLMASRRNAGVLLLEAGAELAIGHHT
jgi:Alginate lyase